MLLSSSTRQAFILISSKLFAHSFQSTVQRQRLKKLQGLEFKKKYHNGNKMFLSQNISKLILFNFKIHNIFSTRLFKIVKTNGIILKIASETKWIYKLKTIISLIVCSCLWIQIWCKISFFGIADIIVAVLVNGSLTLHFVFVAVHFTKRYQIANLFNNCISFETRYNGNKVNFSNEIFQFRNLNQI